MNVLKSQIILLFICLNLFNCAGSSAQGFLNKLIDDKSVENLFDNKKDQFGDGELRNFAKNKPILLEMM